MVASAASTRIASESGGRLEVEFTPIGAAYKGDPRSVETFATHLSSASCGVPVRAGETFLIFAQRDETDRRVAWFHTCNGSRPFGPGTDPADFPDTPKDKIILRLQGLHIAHAVQNPGESPGAPRLPKPGHPNAELIGLIELPTVLNLDEPGASSPPPRLPHPGIELKATPEAKAAAVASIRNSLDVVTREYGYEQKAAVVLERRSDWYRIALPEGRSGWLQARFAGAFHPVAELIVGRRSYLTGHWDGWVWPEPGAGHPANAGVKRSGGRQEYPADVIATQDLAGTLWLRIEILSSDPCNDGTPKVLNAGWIPAYSPEGKLTAWFYSRGC